MDSTGEQALTEAKAVRLRIFTASIGSLLRYTLYVESNKSVNSVPSESTFLQVMDVVSLIGSKIALIS